MTGSAAGTKINRMYTRLLEHYGPRGWWPIVCLKKQKARYHLNAPRTDPERFEIVIGTILTQNVSWSNAEKAVYNLKAEGYLTPEELHRQEHDTIAACIKPSGYYNQKALKIIAFLDWFGSYSYSFSKINNKRLEILRKELLSVKGIGPETADSILLYALHRKIFVIDAYTRRICFRAGIVNREPDYHELQDLFHRFFKGEIEHFKEYHALFVEHGKGSCSKKPLCHGCFLRTICNRNDGI